MTGKARWTILVYVAAHNDLEHWGRLSLERILEVGSTPQLKLAALYDGPNGAERWIASEPGQRQEVESLGDLDSGDPDALIGAARWAFSRCPAERYGLVLWSHGTGWRSEGPERGISGRSCIWTSEEIARIARQVRGDDRVSEQESAERAAQLGSMALFRSTLAQILRLDEAVERAICFDDGSCHSLDTLALERVARAIQNAIGQPLDLLGMDACVMATLEVAYQLRRHVRCLVASEELVPVSGWPYHTILGELKDAPEMEVHDVAALVVQHYVDYYAAHPPRLNRGDVTLAALDLARTGELAQAVDGLAIALLANLQAAHLRNAQRETRGKETLQRRRWESKFGFYLWDLGTLAAHLAAHSDQSAVRQAAREVGAALQPGGPVIAEGHQGEWFEGLGGVSIYAVPPRVQRVSPHYGKLALTQETWWEKLLRAYHAAS